MNGGFRQAWKWETCDLCRFGIPGRTAAHQADGLFRGSLKERLSTLAYLCAPSGSATKRDAHRGCSELGHTAYNRDLGVLFSNKPHCGI